MPLPNTKLAMIGDFYFGDVAEAPNGEVRLYPFSTEGGFVYGEPIDFPSMAALKQHVVDECRKFVERHSKKG